MVTSKLDTESRSEDNVKSEFVHNPSQAQVLLEDGRESSIEKQLSGENTFTS